MGGDDIMDTANRVLLALEDGQVKISGTSSEVESGALIRPGKGVSLFVNGTEITDRQEVFPGDHIEIKLLEETKQDQLEIKITADGMKAEACYIPGIRETHVVDDHPHTDDLIVEGTPLQEPYKTFTIEKIVKALKEKRVVYGLDDVAPAKLLEESETWHSVATGKPVIPGKDGWVEPLFKGAAKSVSYDEQESRVDFRNRFEIEQVNSGDVIALIHPPVTGESGKTVTGEEVPPDPVTRAEINFEVGTELSSDQKQVVATHTGIPSYNKGRVPTFRVDNLYTHKGDVNIKSGNIDFRGHFKVQGNVTEGMKVSADGNIEVGGNVSGATILAGGSVLLKSNCIKCTVSAGWVDMLLKDIYATLANMRESVTLALSASDELARALEQKGKHSDQMEAAVVRSLLQSKFVELPEYANSLMKSLKAAGKSLPGNLTRLINDIAPHFVDYQYSQSLGRPVLREIHEKLEENKGLGESSFEKADITAPYVQNSTMNSTGNIIINGPGVYNSELKCDGEVRISKLFRGGTIEAGGDVYIGEAGSPRVRSEQGKISVPYKSRVYLGSIYENVRVRFGNTEYRCDQTLNNVRIILDQQEFEVKILHWEN